MTRVKRSLDSSGYFHMMIDPIDKEAWIYELKKDERRYDESSFKEKVDTMVAQTPELRKMTIHIGLLTMKDM